MKTVLVAYASRMGSTQEIAAAIGDQLTSARLRRRGGCRRRRAQAPGASMPSFSAVPCTWGVGKGTPWTT